MNAIMLNAAEPKHKCVCCGRPARTEISFRGPDADRKVRVDLCDICRRLLGTMLIDSSDQVAPTLERAV